jgi:hypothetical protein
MSDYHLFHQALNFHHNLSKAFSKSLIMAVIAENLEKFPILFRTITDKRI